MRRLPVFRVVLFGLVILAGIGLFLALAPRTAPLVVPTGTEIEP